MRLLMLFMLLLIPVSVFAQSTPPVGLQGSVTVIHPAPGVRQQTIHPYGDVDDQAASLAFSTFPPTSWTLEASCSTH